MSRRRQLRKYFAPLPTWTVVVIALGLLIIASDAPVGGAVVAGVGGLRFLVWSWRPTDSQVDAWTHEVLKNVPERALAKNGIDRSELVTDTVVLYGPSFRNVGSADIGIKKGWDGRLRFTPVGVTVLDFTADRLAAYQCAVDLATDAVINECTGEYYYRDIVSVSTESESLYRSRGEEGPWWFFLDLVRALLRRFPVTVPEALVLATSGGTSVKVVLQDRVVMKGALGGGPPTDLADRAVQAVRKMLREAKATASNA